MGDNNTQKKAFSERVKSAYKQSEKIGIRDRMWDSDNTAYAPSHNTFFGGATHYQEYDHNVETRARALGPQHLVVTMQNPEDPDLYKNRKMYNPILKRVVQHGANGEVMYTNEALLAEIERINAAEELKVDHLMKKIKYSDDIACAVLLLTDRELKNYLGEGKTFSVRGVSISEKLKAVSGVPSVLEYSTPKEQLVGFHKLRALVKWRLPYVTVTDFGCSISEHNKDSVVDPVNLDSSDMDANKLR